MNNIHGECAATAPKNLTHLEQLNLSLQEQLDTYEKLISIIDESLNRFKSEDRDITPKPLKDDSSKLPSGQLYSFGCKMDRFANLNKELEVIRIRIQEII